MENLNQLRDSSLINKLILIPSPPVKKGLSRLLKKKKTKDIFDKRLKVKGALPNFTTSHVRKSFDEILKNSHYDFIIISYAYWADLIYENSFLNNAKTIIDTHDLLTSQIQNQEGINLGKSFQEEFRRLDLFDEIWAISIDEQYLFSQFVKKKVRLVPITFDAPQIDETIVPDFDLLYVASDNENNIKSINWFVTEVYPKLPKGIKICVIGKVTLYIDNLSGVVKIPFAQNLATFYQRSKIALCPMLAGTGVKIKVVEAFSFGLPVVCTTRGIDGLPNKINNGCLVSDDPDEFALNIVKLINDNTLYSKQKALAREMFNLAFDSEVCLKLLDSSFI
nr:glycosyltransferase [Pedobacter xinjiangensis]